VTGKRAEFLGGDGTAFCAEELRPLQDPFDGRQHGCLAPKHNEEAEVMQEHDPPIPGGTRVPPSPFQPDNSGRDFQRSRVGARESALHSHAAIRVAA